MIAMPTKDKQGQTAAGLLKAVVCEDEWASAQVLEHLLRLLGFSVSIAGNGVDGLELIRRERPQVLVLDLGMPVLDGLSVLDALGAEAPPCVIVLTGFENHWLRLASRRPVRKVLGKPFVASEFLSQIQAWMRER